MSSPRIAIDAVLPCWVMRPISLGELARDGELLQAVGRGGVLAEPAR